MEENKSMEDRLVRELLQKSNLIYKAPDGFTNRFMKSILPSQELSPKLKRPILNLKGKLTAAAVFVLLFLAGLSVGHELNRYAQLDIVSDIKQFFGMDFAVMMTTILFSFAILLIFNELLKKYFVRR